MPRVAKNPGEMNLKRRIGGSSPSPYTWSCANSTSFESASIHGNRSGEADGRNSWNRGELVQNLFVHAYHPLRLERPVSAFPECRNGMFVLHRGRRNPETHASRRERCGSSARSRSAGPGQALPAPPPGSCGRDAVRGSGSARGRPRADRCCAFAPAYLRTGIKPMSRLVKRQAQA